MDLNSSMYRLAAKRAFPRRKYRVTPPIHSRPRISARVTGTTIASRLEADCNCSKVPPGYWLDYGPHRIHSRNDELIQHLYEVLDNEVVIRERLSRIYMQGKFFNNKETLLDSFMKICELMEQHSPLVKDAEFTKKFLITCLL